MPDNREGMVERMARRATALAEEYIPDAFVFALAATLAACAAAVAVDPAIRRSPLRLVDAWGDGFWTLVPFTLQMSMMIIGGYVVATSPPVGRVIGRIAGVPRSPRGAVALVAFVAMSSSLLNWGFSLIFSAMLAKEVGRRLPAADYRALAASSFLGLGTVWAQGLSGSAALQMATPTAMPPRLAELVGGSIPLTSTIFRPQSLACVAIEMVVVTAVMWMAAPTGGRARSASSLGVPPDAAERRGTAAPQTPVTWGERLEQSRVLLLAVTALGFVYLVHLMLRRATSLVGVLNAFDFNTINFWLLVLGATLHGTPAALVRSVQAATPAIAGVLIQFPFYAGIFGVITGTRLSEAIASLFVSASNATLYPAFIAGYSAFLGVFVPSGGSKWVIEAPYVLQAGRALGVADGWVVVTYDLGEALANLVQPFWMLPVLALLGLRARDIMGYTYLVAAVLLPLVLVLVTVFRP
jgi:short-chain fatty acids transporter